METLIHAFRGLEAEAVGLKRLLLASLIPGIAAAFLVAGLSTLGVHSGTLSSGTDVKARTSVPNQPTETPASGLETEFPAGAIPIADASSRRHRLEPHIAIDPADPRTILAGAIDSNYAANGRSRLGAYVSHDGGQTWSDRGAINTDSLGAASAYDPIVAFDSSGIAYYAGIARGIGLVVAKSTDHGDSWSLPSIAAAAEKQGALCYVVDKPWLDVDRTNGNLYVAYSWFETDCPAGPLGAVVSFHSSVVLVKKSTDGGLTWTALAPPGGVSQGAPQEGMGAAIRAAPDGTLYVAYVRDVALTEEVAPGCPAARNAFRGQVGTSQLVVASSTDGGASWRRVVMENFCDNAPLSHEMYAQTNSHPKMVIDPVTSAAFVAWSNRDVPSSTIRWVSSADQGRTWIPGPSVSDLGRGAHFPVLTATGGILRLLYLGVDVTSTFHAYYRESLDAGASWSNPLQLDGAGSCVGQCLDGTALNFHDVLDYWAMDVHCGVIAPVWASYNGGAVANIYVRMGSYEPAGEACLTP